MCHKVRSAQVNLSGSRAARGRQAASVSTAEAELCAGPCPAASPAAVTAAAAAAEVAGAASVAAASAVRVVAALAAVPLGAVPPAVGAEVV